jgi:hypothetical protein
VWTAIYNAVWGIAWLGFMRQEWRDAASSSGHLMPWTPGFWAFWLPISLVFGVAISAYLTGVSGRAKVLQPAAAASLVMWVPGTIGMAVLVGFSVRVIVLDSVVNLLALMLASVVVTQGAASWQRRGVGGGMHTVPPLE